MIKKIVNIIWKILLVAWSLYVGLILLNDMGQNMITFSESAETMFNNIIFLVGLIPMITMLMILLSFVIFRKSVILRKITGIVASITLVLLLLTLISTITFGLVVVTVYFLVIVILCFNKKKKPVIETVESTPENK